MITTKITEDEIGDKKISSLPTRPNASTSLGGAGYGAAEMKEAFDKLPLFIIEKFNSLLDDISRTENGITDSINTGIYEMHTLSSLFKDITNGNFSAYLVSLDDTLDMQLLKLRRDINTLAERMGVTFE